MIKTEKSIEHDRLKKLFIAAIGWTLLLEEVLIEIGVLNREHFRIEIRGDVFDPRIQTSRRDVVVVVSVPRLRQQRLQTLCCFLDSITLDPSAEANRSG